MGSAQTIERLYFLPHQVDYLLKGEVALGQVDEEKGHVCMRDIPFDWIVGYTRERHGAQNQYFEVQKKPSVTGTCSQRSRWVVAEDYALFCLDNGVRIVIFEYSEGCARVDYRHQDDGTTILFKSEGTESKSAHVDCREYLERLARFVGAMPQREGVEASAEIET
ncbi:MAG: hypothetical protein WC242_01870 [Candidatus Paceibacterota bacterium]|jgi:hypothetical protein